MDNWRLTSSLLAPSRLAGLRLSANAQQYVPLAQSPTHDVASSTVVQSAAQRGKASAVPVVSSAVQ